MKASMFIRLIYLIATTSLISFGLLACSGFPTENKDPLRNNKAAYSKDLKECQEDYPELGSGVHYRQWIGCMNLKGWK
jgi:hypothetical protein